jgi:short-subunit dehydrogenase
MINSLQGKVVLITGASAGIGKALATTLIKSGVSVAICARDEQKLLAVKAMPNHEKLFCFKADVAVEADCKAFIEASFNHFGQIDVLINNAGVSMRALFEALDLSVLKKTMDINFWGTVYCSKYALPYIIKTKGSIVGISSIAGYKGLPCRTGYSASKFAMQGFLESLRIELMQKGVNVMWISPGFVASNIRNTALDANGESQTETPLDERKLMSADECAKKIVYAIVRRKRNLLMTFQGKLTVWLNYFFPSFVDKQIYNHFKNEPDSPLVNY